MGKMTDLEALKVLLELVKGDPHPDLYAKQHEAVSTAAKLVASVEKAEPHTKLKMAEDAMSETGHVPISYATHDDVLERLKDEYGFVKAVPHEDLTAAIDSALSAEDLPVGYGEFYGDVLNTAAEQIIEWHKEDDHDD
jgi:hypothetical protein